jgi:hypothetical protein
MTTSTPDSTGSAAGQAAAAALTQRVIAAGAYQDAHGFAGRVLPVPGMSGA